jgi:hypothetical protein
MFHVFLILQLDDGVQLRVEKNEVINISVLSGRPYFTGSYDMGHVDIRLSEFLEKTRRNMGDEKYFLYDPQNNNCQVFLLSLLRSNGLLTPDIQEFFSQNTEDVVGSLQPYVKKFAQGAISAAQILNVILYGSGY